MRYVHPYYAHYNAIVLLDIIAERPALLVMELLDMALWLCNVREMPKA